MNAFSSLPHWSKTWSYIWSRRLRYAKVCRLLCFYAVQVMNWNTPISRSTLLIIFVHVCTSVLRRGNLWSQTHSFFFFSSASCLVETRPSNYLRMLDLSCFSLQLGLSLPDIHRLFQRPSG